MKERNLDSESEKVFTRMFAKPHMQKRAGVRQEGVRVQRRPRVLFDQNLKNFDAIFVKLSRLILSKGKSLRIKYFFGIFKISKTYKDC